MLDWESFRLSPRGTRSLRAQLLATIEQ
jgi:hypothetical protein